MSGRQSFAILAVWAVLVFPAPGGAAAAGKPLLANGTFRSWQNGLPVGWKVGVGARRGSGTRSSIRKDEKGGIVLEGNARTREWRIVSQFVPCIPGDSFQLRFRAGASGIRRDPGQRDNCYVGFLFRDKNGKTVSFQIQSIRSAKPAPEILLGHAPAMAAGCDIAIFLSKTGRLAVGDLELRKLSPEDSYAALVEYMDRYYSYFALRKINWKALTDRYANRAKQAKSTEDFAGVARELLAHLKDMHVWVVLPGGRRIVPYPSRVDGNYNYRHVAGRLKDLKQIGRVAFTGRTQDGFGYIAIGSLAGPEAAYRQIEQSIDGMLDSKGFIVDLRGNGGGDERRGQRVASRFADKSRVYAKSRYRAGPRHDDFTSTFTRSIGPRKGKTFTRPVVCLIGPRCVSSGEGFALMMKAIPHVKLIGQPTRGASGNPRPVLLPNGVTVYFSRWVAMDADGKVIESKGIKPDVTVKHSANGDPTFDRAVSELNKMISEGRAR